MLYQQSTTDKRNFIWTFSDGEYFLHIGTRLVAQIVHCETVNDYTADIIGAGGFTMAWYRDFDIDAVLAWVNANVRKHV